jgi:hypothetical protein
MPTLATMLVLSRCPHCNVDTPNLAYFFEYQTNSYSGDNLRWWRFYRCGRCGGVVTAAARDRDLTVSACFPSTEEVNTSIPDRARAYLEQALNSLSSPAGAIMLAASAVDAMLKARGLREGSLYSRIDQAESNHQITPEMARWAHDVRLDANDQRHADEEQPLPGPADAGRAVDFALALGEFMFVLPARVQRGIADASNG